LLTRIAGNFGLIWRYNGTSVELSRYITRVFTVQALPGEMSIKDGVGDVQDSGSSSSSSSSAGGSYSASSSSSLKQSSEMQVEMKVWDELAATVRAIIGSDGKAVISPSSGTVTVTATPSVMEAVAAFIKEENERLSHQIAINVEIYSVTIEDTDNVDVSLSTAFARLGDLKFNVASAAGTASEAVQGTMGTMSLAILNGGAERVSSVFKALSYVGDTTRVAQFPLTTLNNRPVARRIGRDRTYVASISNDSSTESSYSSSTVEPGTIREGFSLQLTPRLLDDGRIMMQYSLSLTDIVDIATFDTGSAGTIELPETSSRVFVQQTMLRSGSTLVIGGYDDEKTTQSSQGVGSPYNYFLGGGSTNSKSRSMLFIAITPQVLDILPTEQL
jgi:type IVB pilus formation R64 PilN family outer membrane protein